MSVAIKGIFENGQVKLAEPAAPTEEKVSVTIIFPEKEEQPLIGKPERVIGSLAGKISIPDDLNEPLDDLKEYMY